MFAFSDTAGDIIRPCRADNLPRRKAERYSVLRGQSDCRCVQVYVDCRAA